MFMESVAECSWKTQSDPWKGEMSQLDGIRACVFGAYGTIFASAAARCAVIWMRRWSRSCCKSC